MKLLPPIPTLDLTTLRPRPAPLSTEAFTCRLLGALLACFVFLITAQLILAILWNSPSTPSLNPRKTSNSSLVKASPPPSSPAF